MPACEEEVMDGRTRGGYNGGWHTRRATNDRENGQPVGILFRDARVLGLRRGWAAISYPI